MRHTPLLVLFLFFALTTHAQTWQWAVQPTKNNTVNTTVTSGQAVRTDAAGNVYVLGGMNGSHTFGTTSLSSSTSDVTLSKFTSSGAWLWAVSIPSGTSDSPRGLAVAPNGDVYVSGTYDQGSITIGSTTHTSSGSADIFIAKYNTSGVLQWSTKAGSASTEFATGLAVDANNDLIVGGYFQGNLTFGNAGTLGLTRAGSTGNDIFVAKLSSAGTWVWSVRGGGADGQDYCRGLDVDAAGNIYLVGNFRNAGNATFGGTTLTSNGGTNDILLAKLDNNGNWLWAIKGDGPGSDVAQGVAASSSGDVYVTGTSMATVTFGGPGIAINNTSTTTGDVFVAKASGAGVWRWAVRGGSTGTNDDTGFDIDADASGNVYVTGAIAGSATFGTHGLSHTGSNDIFVAKLNDQGEWLWALQAGGSDFEEGLSIAADDNGSAYVAGTYSSGSVNFGSLNRTASPVGMMYVAKAGVVPPPNSPPTNIALSAAAVAENQPVNTVVGTLSSTDPDAGNTFTYALVTGAGSTDNAAFNIAGSSLRASAAFDYEAKSSYSIRVRTTDSGTPGLTFEKVFTITVTDVDDTAPSVVLSSTAANPTSTSPIPVTATFSEAVTGFSIADVTVGNGSVASLSGSGTTYSLSIVPTANGNVTVNIAANVAADAAGNGNTAAAQFRITYNQPATATPVVTSPANNASINDNTPTYQGSAAANSTVTVYVDGASIGTTTATVAGTWSLTQSAPLSSGPHAVYARAQSSGASQSANSNTNSFTLDTTAPTVSMSSTASNPTSTTPIPVFITFSESVSGFSTADLTVTNATPGAVSGAGATYSVSLTPTAPGAVTVNIAANAAVDAAGNGNSAAAPFTITYQLPAPTLTSVAPNPGGRGQSLTLTGTNLGSPTALTINGASALNHIVSNSGTSLLVRVPATAAASGSVSITTAGGTATVTNFTLMSGPGNALAFDGTNDVVRIPSPISGDFTLEYWVNTTQAGQGSAGGPWYLGTGIVDGEQPNVQNDFGTALMAGKLAFGMGNPDRTIHSTTSINDGRWHHVAATREAATGIFRLYIDGRLEATGTGAGTANRSPTQLALGAMQTGVSYFAGRLDELRIWSTVRSLTDIQASYRQLPALPQTGLQAYYNFDVGVPATASTGSNTGVTSMREVVSGTAVTLSNFALSSGNTTSNWVESYALAVPESGAAADRQPNSFTATWTAPVEGRVTGYLLDVATDQAFTAPVSNSPFALSASATSAAVSGLTNGRTYYYRVRALNAGLPTPDQGGYSATAVAATPLPVELATFTAVAESAGAVRLRWSTAQEKNSAFFAVERSLDGRSFASVGTVPAAGSSTGLLAYAYVDDQLPIAGLLYYRLRQVDQDSRTAYSPVQAVRLSASTRAKLQVLPNPARSRATLTGAAPGAPVQVYDATGRLVLTTTADESGTAQLQFSGGRPAGVYLVRSGAQVNRYILE
ncbi:Ig-like domain-containing protein [Solirubrum puertoriconensis]|uniref:Staphylococcus aureus surface protein A n=1 Tax=Solirubrum puertoriconensis TaxID=1751427 RepID=A0A9X0HNC5_SOLP1|nr:Ig-like domain-containing protein [Solirubrum puertoriconensis]KUG09105.1 hypothetical protein ASU33_20000 [Solirubrum puertoriconensis]